LAASFSLTDKLQRGVKSGRMALMKPGEELVNKGIADLAAGRETVESLLVSIGAPRLRRAGIEVPQTTFSSPEHRLYELLYTRDADSAYSRYNSLIRRLVSFEHAAECVI
jgi:hypothetical protein